MARPNARRETLVESNCSEIARARTRQVLETKADANLHVALRDLDRAEHNVAGAERVVGRMHAEDEALCRQLRAHNVALQSDDVKAVAR